MILTVTYFDPDTGRITGSLMGPMEDVEANRAEDGWIEGSWSAASFYVVADGEMPVAALRPTLPALPVDGTTFDLGGLPEATAVIVRTEDGEVIILPEGEATLTLTGPGSFTLLFRPSFPWLPADFEVEAP